jgi:peptide/nickel transport system permease protein
MEAFTPPSWTDDGLSKFILGTDGQGKRYVVYNFIWI